MRILSYNKLREAIITTSSNNELFPSPNLYDKRRVKQFWFTGNVSENIVINLTGLQFNSVILDSHNLTDSAVVKFQANGTDVWTSPSVDETATIREAITFLWDSVQTYDYFRVLIEDPTNTEPIKIGMLFLSDGEDYEIIPGWTLSRVIYGQTRYRTVSGSFLTLLASDKDNLKDQLDDLEGTVQLSVSRQQSGTAWPPYVIIDPDDLDILPIYGILQTDISLTRSSGLPEQWDVDFQIEEVN